MAGIDGTYSGSCVVCLRGTDTGIAFAGEAEWGIAGLVVLGVPEGDASRIVVSYCEQELGCEPGSVPDGEVTIAVQVCEKCAEGSPFSVRLVSEGLQVIRPATNRRTRRRRSR